jgi:hypothetical protein
LILVNTQKTEFHHFLEGKEQADDTAGYDERETRP